MMTYFASFVTCLRGFLPGLLAGAVTAGALAAQTVTVTLEASNGDLSVSGRLLEVTESALKVATQVGEVDLVADDVTCTGRACPFTGALPEQSIPEKMRRIELSSLDKLIDIEGELRGLTKDRRIVEVPNVGLVSLSPRGLRCSGPGCRVTWDMLAPAKPVAKPLQIVGSRDLTDGVLAPLLRAYAAQNASPDAMRRLSDSTYLVSLKDNAGTFFVGTTGTSVAFGALATGAADFALAARQPNDSEVALMIEAGIGDLRGSIHETELAVGGLSIVTHSTLGLAELSLEQIAGIYRGEITNWSAVGGPDQPITVLTREPGSSESALFNQAVFGDPFAARGQSGIIVSSTKEVKDILSSDRNAIGYVWQAMSDGLAQIDLVGSCGMKSLSDPYAYLTGDSSLATRLYLYANPKTQNEHGRDFAAFAGSPRSYAAFDDSQFASKEIDRMPLSDLRAASIPTVLEPGLHTQVAVQFMDEIGKWDRLSTTFRFADNARTFSPTQQNDMTDLLAYLDTLPNKDRIAVIGFGDASADFPTSLEVSNLDAVRVADHLAEKGQNVLAGMTILSGSYGSLAQVFCDTAPDGARLNRRVEIWVPKSSQ